MRFKKCHTKTKTKVGTLVEALVSYYLKFVGLIDIHHIKLNLN